ncbi:hypothetical protein [Phaffia rhodozyma]|uniref:Uncharacterized protein n=1 Tax=Phaffia rhodozyma TaxID=264483 RepID=A0A0F7STG0_PHARH|nr:hypothetical protein [Phaffia rhodozyma]
MAAFLSRTLSCLAPTSPQATQSPPLSPNSVHTQEPFSTTSALSPSSSSSSLSSSFSHSSFLSPPPSSSSSPPSLSSSVSSLLSPPSTKDVLWSNGMLKMQVPLYSVSVSRQSSKKTISLVLMTAETSYDVLVQISRDLARNPKRRQPLDVKQLDRLIHEKLPFQTSPSPDLLLIHRLSTPSLWARLALSISPSWGEIDGLRLWDYPPWGLRVTEIYQTSYSSIFSSLASSKLSFFGTRSIRPLGPEDWAQALRAWDGVEQRFGK